MNLFRLRWTEFIGPIRCNQDADLVSGEASVMFFVFSRLAFGHNREIRLVQIDPTYQKDILLAVRKHGKYLGNLIFSSCFRVSIAPSRTGKGMEFEEVHHIFVPFGYGNLMGVKYSPCQWGERFAAVKATTSSCSIAEVT